MKTICLVVDLDVGQDNNFDNILFVAITYNNVVALELRWLDRLDSESLTKLPITISLLELVRCFNTEKGQVATEVLAIKVFGRVVGAQNAGR